MANKKMTPLLRPMRNEGATMYVFPSASEDIGLNIDNRANSVYMSHFALLNIPKSVIGKGKGTDNEKLPEQLQNYVMNFETRLLNDIQYDYQEYKTVTERVFFHWLNDYCKAMKFSTVDLNIVKESGDSIVKCFGCIDAANSLDTEFGMFNETYVNIPTSYGSGPVYFRKALEDLNYILDNEYKCQEENTSKLLGRTVENAFTRKYITTVTPDYDSGTSYRTGKDDGYEIVKDLPTIQKALEKELKKDFVSISSFDDVNVDSKALFVNSIYDLTEKPNEFEFNTILLYYTIVDTNDATNNVLATNLFGVIFLDGVDNGEIHPFIKKKSFKGSVETESRFGTSYSFRVNVKSMSVYDNVDAYINDNTTMSSAASMDMSDVIANLNKAIDVMNTNVQTTMAILDSYLNILSYYDDLKTRIDSLEERLDTFILGKRSSALDASTLFVNTIHPLDTASGAAIHFSVVESVDELTHKKNYTLDVALINKDGILANEVFTLIPTEIYDGNLVTLDRSNITKWLNYINVMTYCVDGNKDSMRAVLDASMADSNMYSHLVRYIDGRVYMDYASLVPYIIGYLLALRNDVSTMWHSMKIMADNTDKFNSKIASEAKIKYDTSMISLAVLKDVSFYCCKKD